MTPSTRSRGHLVDLLRQRSDYRSGRSDSVADAVPGLTVGLVALPLAHAFGVTTGVGAAALLRERIAVSRLDGALFFGVARLLLAILTRPTDVRVVILRLSTLRMLDATGRTAAARDRGVARAPRGHGPAERLPAAPPPDLGVGRRRRGARVSRAGRRHAA